MGLKFEWVDDNSNKTLIIIGKCMKGLNRLYDIINLNYIADNIIKK